MNIMKGILLFVCLALSFSSIAGVRLNCENDDGIMNRYMLDLEGGEFYSVTEDLEPLIIHKIIEVNESVIYTHMTIGGPDKENLYSNYIYTLDRATLKMNRWTAKLDRKETPKVADLAGKGYFKFDVQQCSIAINLI